MAETPRGVADAPQKENMTTHNNTMTEDEINAVINDLKAHSRANEFGVHWHRIRMHAEVDKLPMKHLAYNNDSIVVSDTSGRVLERLNAFMVNRSPSVALYELAAISRRAPEPKVPA